MIEISTIIIIAFILAITSTIGATMGYGLGVISLPFLCYFISVKTAVPLVGTLGGIASLYLAVKAWRDINWTVYRGVLIWVAVGFPVGLWAFHNFKIGVLNYFIGVFIVIVALQGLVDSYRGDMTRRWPKLFGRAVLILGGFIHGAFTTGGPPIVAYTERELKEKSQFRATMLALWSVLNPIFILIYWLSPERNLSVLWLILCCIPSIMMGMFVGQRLHRRVPERTFRKAVFFLLLLAGISRLIPRGGDTTVEVEVRKEPPAIAIAAEYE